MPHFWGIARRFSSGDEFSKDYLVVVSKSKDRAIEVIKRNTDKDVLIETPEHPVNKALFGLMELNEIDDTDARDKCVYLVRDTNKILYKLPLETAKKAKNKWFYQRDDYNKFLLDKYYEEGIVNSSGCKRGNSVNIHRNNKMDGGTRRKISRRNRTRKH